MTRKTMIHACVFARALAPPRASLFLLFLLLSSAIPAPVSARTRERTLLYDHPGLLLVNKYVDLIEKKKKEKENKQKEKKN